ncbi:maleylpyruvate isomerase family mycothiol-dependent enzyme [Pseudonocardia halophobica]|uniref:Maleylpyruvate isomerase n=1 Tax=Pseudonocardia halophobica TaxID=29401 RepID=A0A9W6KZH2_9PSEU|nr:maleylpyruvate isomerase family mycothiol-dependent enzyme [Pseudonocardia halophobica]GLL10233.1 maleylpyruvate isomerase [Pseudonocardia halophobica]
MSRHDLDRTLPWMREGTAFLETQVAALTDDELRAPSALPGWTRAHVVGHVARNAEALTRLAGWARTGIETPMYADRAQRAAEIEASAELPASTLRAELTATARALEEALAALTPAQWDAHVRSALGRAIPAAEVPWMRIREVWLHALDLGAGAKPGDLPDGVLDLLLDDVTAALSGKEDCPSLELVPVDRTRPWLVGTGEPVGTMTGSAAELVGWLTGRIADPTRPPLPRWL